MSTVTLAISCLTTSILPWLMDLTFQVPMQYCSLQHRTLLLSPVTSTTGYCFCPVSIPSFFLELFLHWSPVAYWAPTDLGLDLIDRVPDELWNEVRDFVQETGIKTIPMEKKCKKAKWLSKEALQIAVKRRGAKSKRRKRKVFAFECRLPKTSKER